MRPWQEESDCPSLHLQFYVHCDGVLSRKRARQCAVAPDSSDVGVRKSLVVCHTPSATAPSARREPAQHTHRTVQQNMPCRLPHSKSPPPGYSRCTRCRSKLSWSAAGLLSTTVLERLSTPCAGGQEGLCTVQHLDMICEQVCDKCFASCSILVAACALNVFSHRQPNPAWRHRLYRGLSPLCEKDTLQPKTPPQTKPHSALSRYAAASRCPYSPLRVVCRLCLTCRQ